MMMRDAWFHFLLATSLVSFSPGVNTLTVVQSSLRQGFIQTLWVVAGQQMSLITQMTLVAAGLLATPPSVLMWIRIVGSMYLAWIGVNLLRASQGTSGCESKETKPPGFWRGYWVNASNPKALVFQAAFVPQFLTPAEPLFGQYVVLGIVMLGVEFATMVSYAGFASTARQWVASASVKTTFERLCGAMFVGLAVLMAFGQ